MQNAEILSKPQVLKYKPVVVHLICWSAFIFVEVIVAGLVRQRFNSIAYYFMFCSMNIGLFYLHGNFVMRYAKNSGILQLVQFFLLIIGEIAIYGASAMLTNLILLHVFGEQPESGLKFNIAYFAVVIYRALFFIAFGTGYYFLKQYLRRKEDEMKYTIQVEKLENQLLTTQKDYLRAQINPHLLFNTLDFIKAVSKKKPEQSDEAIDCLTEIMDYALETNKEDFVNVEREIEQIEHMIRLNLLRSGNRLNLKFNKEILHAAPIIPIVLITLVENIFKHGNLLDKNNTAVIELATTSKYVLFRSRNLIANTPPSKREHTGLKNIRARLAHAYPENHFFKVDVKGNVFYTELKIDYL